MTPEELESRDHPRGLTAKAMAELAAASTALDEAVAPDPDKPLDQRIRDEFHDFKMLLDHCSEVYMAASGGLVSEPQTLPSVVIGLMEDMINKIVEDEVHQLKVEAKERDAECDRYLSLLRRVVELTRLTVERTPAGYPDVADFLREEEATS